MEATIQNKMRLDKCDVYTAKETLGYRGRKILCVSGKRRRKKKRQQRWTEGETNLQTHYWSSSIKRRDEPMKKAEQRK